MSSIKQEASLLAVVVDFLNSSDVSELEQLAHGKAELRIIPTDEVESRTDAKASRQKTNGSARFDMQAQPEIEKIARQLNEADSREEAESLIASIKVAKGKGRKDFLVRLAKACAVYVESKDSIARIERKLIENTVGAKLRSKAFREVAF